MNEVNALIADIAHRLQLDLVSPVGAGLADRVASEASKPSVARRLSEPARQVAKHLCERSVNAMELDPIVELSELIELLGVGVEELELVIDELRDLGWITTRTDASSPIGIASVSPTARMFIAMDPIVKGWNPLGDSRVLLGLLRKEGRRDGFRLAELAEESGWAPRRINVSAQLLDQEGFIRSDRTTGSGPFAFQTARLLARGRRV
jgi:hypothetical protein